MIFLGTQFGHRIFRHMKTKKPKVYFIITPTKIWLLLCCIYGCVFNRGNFVRKIGPLLTFPKYGHVTYH